MKICVSNQESFVDEKIHILVTHLPANSRLTVTLKMELPWCKGEEFSSYAVFHVNNDGVVDLDRVPPLEGTYTTATSMGLIYSLKLSKSIGENIAENISIKDPIIMNLVFESSTEKKEVILTRNFKGKDLEITEIRDCFNGNLYFQKNSQNKTVLMLGGSDGQIESLSLLAGPLASRGLNVLTVPYFGKPGLPEKLEEVPLEYFEGIFNWIEKNEITKTNEVFIHGTSKGGELALLLASRYSRIKKVVAVSPHIYCFQALDGMMSGNNVSSWSYEGKSLPFIPIDNDIFFSDCQSDIKKGIPFGFTSTYKKSIEKAANKLDARIKIENSDAEILLIAGEKDNIWNSYDACRDIIKILKSNNYSHNAEFLSYGNMGHPLPVPYVIPISFTLELPMNGGIFSSGGTVEGNAEGQYESFSRTINFLKNGS
jgi:esterase/lipase